MPRFQFPDAGWHVPEQKHPTFVSTPYGAAKVVRIRRSQQEIDSGSSMPAVMRELELLDWKQPDHTVATKGPRRPAMLYTTVDYPSVPATVEDDVLTIYGRGRVIAIHESSSDNSKTTIPKKKLVVKLSSWRLAARSLVTCYLQPSAVQVVQKKTISQMDAYEKADAAAAFKQQAADQFAASDYHAALLSYSKAVDASRYVQYTAASDNYVRADLVVLMITCSNNAALCCLHLQKAKNGQNFAKNALALIHAMEAKRHEQSRIRDVLNKDGISNGKLFGEWQIKSLSLQARAYKELGETDLALETLQKALQCVETYRQETNLTAHEKQVQRLIASCRQAKQAQLKKEKQRARAMFGAVKTTTTTASNSSTSKSDAKQTEVSPTTATNAASTTPALATATTSTAAPFGADVSNTATPPSSTRQAPPSTPAAPPRPILASSADPLANLSPASKKRVTFTEPTTTGNDDDANHKRNGDDDDDDDDELEWYQDSEVLVGLALFAGSCAATMLLMHHLLSKRS